MWLYNTNRRSDNLTVSFDDTATSPGTPVTISQFNISLNFQVIKVHLHLTIVEFYSLS